MDAVVTRQVVVAVDGGGSKTDAAVVDALTGEVLGRSRSGGCSHHQIGIPAAVQVVDAAVTGALAAAGVDPSAVSHAGCYLTAIDLPEEQSAVHAALSVLPWARRSLVVDNDVFALLRAGTDAPDAAVVVCGTGINGVAVRADGESARVLALGQISGDWGGASGLAIADAGDAVATTLVQRQGEEVGLLAASLLTRLGLQDDAVPVVLGGGIGAAGDPLLVAAAERTLAERAPRATLTIVSAPPIDGAVHLALESERSRRTSA